MLSWGFQGLEGAPLNDQPFVNFLRAGIMFYLPLKNTFLATWKLVCFRQNTHYSSGGLIPLQGPGGLTLQVNPEAGVPSAGG